MIDEDRLMCALKEIRDEMRHNRHEQAVMVMVAAMVIADVISDKGILAGDVSAEIAASHSLALTAIRQAKAWLSQEDEQ